MGSYSCLIPLIFFYKDGFNIIQPMKVLYVYLNKKITQRMYNGYDSLTSRHKIAHNIFETLKISLFTDFYFFS